MAYLYADPAWIACRAKLLCCRGPRAIWRSRNIEGAGDQTRKRIGSRLTAPRRSFKCAGRVTTEHSLCVSTRAAFVLRRLAHLLAAASDADVRSRSSHQQQQTFRSAALRWPPGSQVGHLACRLATQLARRPPDSSGGLPKGHLEKNGRPEGGNRSRRPRPGESRAARSGPPAGFAYHPPEPAKQAARNQRVYVGVLSAPTHPCVRVSPPCVSSCAEMTRTKNSD